MSACHKEGGMGWSRDAYTYVSREWQPWTVTLVDTRTGESLWSVDIPVGQQLVMAFRKGAGPNEFKPDMLDWGLMPAGRQYGVRTHQLPVPPSHARRLEPTLRPTPELPGTPVPGSPYSAVDSSKVEAADKGKIAPGTADAWKAATPRPYEPASSRPVPVPAPPPPPPPAEPSSEPEATQPESTEPPIDLPQGSRGPR